MELAEKNEELLKALNQYAAEMRAESNAECRTLKNKKAALENSRSHLMAVLESGKAKESILNRLDTIETELSEISKRIEQSAVEEHIFTDEDLKNKIETINDNGTLTLKDSRYQGGEE